MAVRPIFLPLAEAPFWDAVDVEFQWHPGMAISQKQKSIDSLHHSALDTLEISWPLEVSSKSTSALGTCLSAFRLGILHETIGEISLESAFQGSKVFSQSGQIIDAYNMESRESKAFAGHINESEELVGFHWMGRNWPLEPKSWFYDWLYINGIVHSLPEAPAQIRRHDAFTDIEFNPKKSFNCQARSCAIIASTKDDEELRALLMNPDSMVGPSSNSTPNQVRLF